MHSNKSKPIAAPSTFGHTIAGRITEQSELYPNKIAIHTKQRRYTYTELNNAANRIASVLLEESGDGNEAVALLFEDTGKMASSMLGAIKAGKFYVALDASYPQDRIKFMVADSEAPVLLCDTQHIDLARVISPEQVVVINVDELGEKHVVETTFPAVPPQARISLVYTSGSTGTPKGIVKTHANMLRGMDSSFVNSDSRVAHIFSTSFSAGGWAIVRGLYNGASLYRYDIKREGLADLSDWVRKHKITNLRLTPSILRQFAKLLGPKDKFPDLKFLRLSTEPILKKDIDLYKRFFSENALLRVTYACTEVGVLSYEYFDGNTPLPDNLVPVGRPIKGKTIFLWDENSEQVAEGQTGEIVVAGDDIRPSYWRGPEGSRNGFLPDPDRSGNFLYRTGDLGKFLPDGRLVHMGRMDSMVKVRGFRVETSEIERVLLKEEFINEAAVEGRRDANGNMRLAAYLVLADGSTLDVASLRRKLAAHLPDYMIPVHYRTLEGMPLTANNKLDRSALPDPPPGRPALGSQLIAPQGKIESKLAAIWEQVLGIKPVGVVDNFFDLGGDSLLAAQLFVEIEKEFGRKLPLSILYQASNVREQASILQQEPGDHRWMPLVALNITGTKQPLFCFPGKGGNPIRFRHLAQRLGDDQPIYMLQSRGLSGEQIPHEELEAIGREFLSAVQEVQPQGPYNLIGSSFGGKVAYEVAQQLLAAGQKVDLLALIDTFGPGYPQRLPQSTRAKKWLFDRMQYVAKHVGNLRVADWSGKIAYIAHYIKEAGRLLVSLPRALLMDRRRKEIPRVLVAVEKANLIASRAYQPSAYPGKVVLFRARQQPWGIHPDPTLGWGSVKIDELEIHEVPGHHGSILFEPRVGKLAELLEHMLVSGSSNPT
ncbi:MAG: AMP-binding protein [Anaerolineae bacterium]|nr:AMP-binding protein [Anaerolineae bacterium]